jgi:hypothetical protein
MWSAACEDGRGSADGQRAARGVSALGPTGKKAGLISASAAPFQTNCAQARQWSVFSLFLTAVLTFTFLYELAAERFRPAPISVQPGVAPHALVRMCLTRVGLCRLDRRCSQWTHWAASCARRLLPESGGG